MGILTGFPPVAMRMVWAVMRWVPPLVNATSTVCLSISLPLPSAVHRRPHCLCTMQLCTTLISSVEEWVAGPAYEVHSCVLQKSVVNPI